MSYLFVDANEFTQVYQKNHPGSSDKQWLEILTLAVNEVCKGDVTLNNVAYDAKGSIINLVFELSPHVEPATVFSMYKS
jgi:hypothetical protein